MSKIAFLVMDDLSEIDVAFTVLFTDIDSARGNVLA
jgi:hypothetical protein